MNGLKEPGTGSREGAAGQAMEGAIRSRDSKLLVNIQPTRKESEGEYEAFQ